MLNRLMAMWSDHRSAETSWYDQFGWSGIRSIMWMLTSNLGHWSLELMLYGSIWSFWARINTLDHIGLESTQFLDHFWQIWLIFRHSIISHFLITPMADHLEFGVRSLSTDESIMAAWSHWALPLQALRRPSCALSCSNMCSGCSATALISCEF